MLARIMCAERELESTSSLAEPHKPGHLAETQHDPPRKRRRTSSVSDPAHLPPECTGADCGKATSQDACIDTSPGVVLLARDPKIPGRLWPVVVAARDDLPAGIAQGHNNDTAKCIGFPLSFKVGAVTT